jgi:hypothetical protein
LAEGGIVKARPGGTLARIAEAGSDEMVIPLNRGAKELGKTIKIYNYAPLMAERDFAQLVESY